MNNSHATPVAPPPYGPLVPLCASYGIGRTRSFALAKEGLLDVFKLGSTTMVTRASLDALPARLAARDSGSPAG